MERKNAVLLAMPLALAVVCAIWGLKIHAELAQGQAVFWLAELWTPAAVLTLVVVVCVDLATAAPKVPPKALPDKKNSGRAHRP